MTKHQTDNKLERFDGLSVDRPKNGDVALGCVHRPNPRHGAHWYWMGERGLDFQPIGSDRLVAQWMFVCKACFAKFGEDIGPAILRGEVHVNHHIVIEHEEFTFL